MSQDAIGVSVEASVRAFGVDQEISFRLCLYIINFFKSGEDRYSEFKKFRQSYDDRSRVAHGASRIPSFLHDKEDVRQSAMLEDQFDESLDQRP